MHIPPEATPHLTLWSLIINPSVRIRTTRNNKLGARWLLHQLNRRTPGRFSVNKFDGVSSDSILCRQPVHTQPAQSDTASRPNIIRCLIPGCPQTFSRSDAHGTHLRNRHNIPIPRGRHATTWMSRPENLHHYTAAREAQLRAVGIVSSSTGEGET